jgi:teichuronic acid biosynthesis glycosyltransferase TuaH
VTPAPDSILADSFPHAPAPNARAATRSMMRDLIFVSLEDWDDVWRRNQFLCAAIARRFPDIKILFVGLPRNLSRDLRKGNLNALRAPATTTLPDFPNITLTHALKLLPDSLAFGRRINEAMARRHIQSVAQTLRLTDPLLWINPYSAWHMAGAMNERAVIYDITDDWTMAPSFSPRDRDLITEQDRALCGRADLVVVCSEALEASRRAQCRQLLLLPNGVDGDRYARIPDATQPGPWPRPVFGYTGTLHGDRFDVSIVAALAAAFPTGSILLVGPDHLTPAEREKLAPHSNIHITGPVPYPQIPGVMAQFDACIVPHVETKFTNSLNPLKLWEYLASGKPVVSTNVAGFSSYPDLCRIASGPAPFVEACRAALTEDGSLRAARRAEAGKHNWDHRVDLLLDTLASKGLTKK